MSDVIYVDGSGYGVCCIARDYDIYSFVKVNVKTVNECEYMAVYYGLCLVNGKHTIIYSDSQLVVNQLNDAYRIREKRLQRLYDLCKRKMEGKDVVIEWIPRERNIAGKIIEKRQADKRLINRRRRREGKIKMEKILTGMQKQLDN